MPSLFPIGRSTRTRDIKTGENSVRRNTLYTVFAVGYYATGIFRVISFLVNPLRCYITGAEWFTSCDPKMIAVIRRT